ncbi:O-antigen ligase family protein [Pontibacter sp. CAU 1760]
MRFSTRISLSAVLVKLLVAVLLFNGFITNFLSFSATNLGTVFIDLLLILLLLHLLLYLRYGVESALHLDRTYCYLLLGWLVLFAATAFKLILLDHNPWPERILGLRNNVVYIAPFLYLPLLFNKEEALQKVIRVLLGLGMLLVVFSLIQFAFSDQLPRELLVLRGEGRFGFFGTDIVRPTALLGNTIIYASFTLILFSFFLAKHLYQPRKTYLVFMLLTATANLLTFTRAALVGLIMVLLVSLFLRYARFTLNFVLRIMGFLLLISGMALTGLYLYQDSFLVRRMTGRDASTQGSTSDHYQQILDAVAYLTQHPWLGSGIGSQGPSGNPATKIITDGYWFQLYLENGIVAGSLFVLFYLSCVLIAVRIFYIAKGVFLKQLSMAFIAFSVYFYAASFLNSAYTGKTNFILYWLLFGSVVAQYLIQKRAQYAYLSSRR